MFRLLLGLVLLASSTSLAQSIRVIKTQGNRAVVEVHGTTLSNGKTYSLGGGSSSMSMGGSSSESRANLFGGSFDMRNISVSNSAGGGDTTSESLNLLLRYGWNFEQFEIGPVFGYVSSKSSGSESSRLKAGAFGDYNIVPNRPGTTGVFGVGGEFYMGTDKVSTVSGSLMEGFVSGFYKWFPMTYPLSFRFDLGYIYQKYAYSDQTLTGTGFVARFGLINYF